jgi:hypothetical protein
MSNLIEKAKLEIDALLQAAYVRASDKGELSRAGDYRYSGIPKDTKNGDYAAITPRKRRALKQRPARLRRRSASIWSLKGAVSKARKPQAPALSTSNSRTNGMTGDKDIETEAWTTAA